MDLVGQITSITAQVLRRLADGVDGHPPAVQQPVIHIHIYGDGPAAQGPPRTRWGRRS